MNLRQRAEAAYQAKLDREAEEEATKEYRRREAHVQRLKALCVQVLGLTDEPFVRWCKDTETEYCRPVACIDGLCFTCTPGDTQTLCLVIFTVHQGFMHEFRPIPVHSLEDLGKKLQDDDLILGHMVGDTIIPAQGDNNAER